MCYLFGSLVAMAAIAHLWLSRDDEDDFAKPILVFCGGAIAMIAIGRARIYTEGMDGILPDGRYVIFSLAAVGVLLHRWIIRVGPTIQAGALAAVMLLSAISYATQIPRHNETWRVLTSRFDTWAIDIRNEYPGLQRQPHYRLLLIEAICSGWYRHDLSTQCPRMSDTKF
jgi:hypothetical protein